MYCANGGRKELAHSLLRALWRSTNDPTLVFAYADF